MWELRNRTPFSADRSFAIDKTGARSYVVVVKGTFNVAPDGKLSIADEQIPIEAAPRYRGEPGESSLIYEQELIAGKPRTDLYLNATAQSPSKRVTEVTVGIRTPAGSKALLVKGDRRWERSAIGTIRASRVEPFETMPIIYERAYGGYDQLDPDPRKQCMDRRNPVGVGFYSDAAHRVGELLPNIERAGSGECVAGFAALCSYWEPRIRYQGTYDADWVETQKPLLPSDYDPQFLQCAPTDQQFSPHVLGGQLIELFNMTPTGFLRFALPKHYFAFTTYAGKKQMEHRAMLSTVIVEADYPRVIMMWASSLECHHDIDAIDYTTISEKEYV